MTVFTDLDVWKVGLALVKEVYSLSQKFPKEERFGLTSQIRRAAASILANLAEGCGRYTYADKTSKFVIARGECTEVMAFICISIELQFVSKQECALALELADRVGKMISRLIAANRSHQNEKTTTNNQ